MTEEDPIDLELRRLLDAEQPGAVLEGGPVPVDSARIEDGAPPWRSAVRSRPILPAWATSADEARTAAVWAWSYVWRTTAFHSLRVPGYAATLAGRSPRGAGRAVRSLLDWLFDAEGHPVRHAAVDRADAERYIKLTDRRNDRVRLRLIVTALIAVPALVVVGVIFALPTLPRLGLLAGLVGLLGWVGAPADRPLISRAVVATRAQKLTSDIVIRALGSLGIAGISQALGPKGSGINFPAPITRDGPGWRADVDLPYGVTVTDILDRRDRLASGLRRPIGCVWPEPAHDQHAGRLILWVGDQDMARAKPPAWPPARKGQVDLFGALPFGTDPRGRGVGFSLFENNVLIGSLPGGGKTNAARVLLCAAALDPTCELWVYELKGSGDLAAAAKVAHRYASGLADHTIEAARDALRELKAEVIRRSEAIASLPQDFCPDGKISRPIANRRTLRLHPLVAVLDEVQNLFAHPIYGAEAGELAEFIIKLGRALGVILILATQRPDAGSLPTGVSANVSVRFCLRVTGQTENDMVLGTSMYKNGIRATTLRPTDRGIGYLVGASDDPQIVRTYYLDKPDADKIADRARAMRVTAGTLSGHAAGETIDPQESGSGYSILEDVLAVVGTHEPKVWSETVVSRLAELRPDAYGGWRAEQLAAALKPHGVPVGRQVWGTDPATGLGANRKGIWREDIATAITERNRRRGAG